ncbi:MAG: hypothetical protein Kow0032_23900 [Methyloligellaceae bacterium]
MRALGEYLSGECLTCHQTSGDNPAIPAISGWDPWLFEVAMEAYRTRERDHAAMQTIAQGLSRKEVQALALYFASLAPPEAESHAQ